MKRIVGVFLAALVGLFFLTAAKQAEQTIKLLYKPNEKVKVTPGPLPPVKIYIEAFKDERPNPQEIGENLEDKNKRVLIITANPNAPAQFVHSAFVREFKDKGFSTEDQLTHAVKIIEGTLQRFWTVETNRYNSHTQLKIEVKDRQGQIYFQNTFLGAGKNFGRSLSETNYYESFSDSIAAIIDSLFSDSEFLKALAAKPVVPTPAAPPPSIASAPEASKVKEPPVAAPPPARVPAAEPTPKPAVAPKKAGTPQTAPRISGSEPKEPETFSKEGKPLAAIPQPSPPVDPKAVASLPPPQEQPPQTTEFIYHKVFSGETLATISKWYAGDTAFWPEIAKYNTALSPFKLNAGEIVKVPLYLATVHTEQPDQSTATAPPVSKPAKKPAPVKGAGTQPSTPAPSSPPPASGPVFGPR
jgi:hypothetical protein